MEEQNITEVKYVREPKKRSKGKIFLRIFLIVLLLIGGLGYWGYRKMVSFANAEDLGVTYTAEDYEALIGKIGMEVEPEKLCLDCEPLNFSNPHEVDLNITDAQASAAFDIANESLSFAKISGSQIKFSDEKGELSTMVTYNGKSYPVYISGNIGKVSERAISGEIYDLKVGGFEIPSSVKNMAQEALVNLANERIATMEDTFRIDNVNLTNEGLNFEGLVPTQTQ